MTGQAHHPLDRLLEDVIGEEGGTCRPRDIRDELVGVIERVTAELAASGQEMTEFCHWSVNEGVGVFTFVGEELSIYVVPCPANRQWELINRFDRMPATDVEAYRARLNARYGKSKPDLVIKPDLAYDWLYGERPVDPSEGFTEELWTGELWGSNLRKDTDGETAEPGAGEQAAATAAAAAPGTEPAAIDPTAGEPATAEPGTEPGLVCASCGAQLVFRGQTTCQACGRDQTGAPERAEGSDGAGAGEGEQADGTEVGDREESLLTLLEAPTLEEMMAAIRAAGGGKGRPIRRSDFD